jgi:hypothetical protein
VLLLSVIVKSLQAASAVSETVFPEAIITLSEAVGTTLPIQVFIEFQFPDCEEVIVAEYK